MGILNRIEAHVDLTQIEKNFREIERFTGNAKIIAVIKADAYGHGACELGHLYERLGAVILAVACIDEALVLRESGITAPIMILGYTPPCFSSLLIKNEIIQAVYSLDYASELSDEAKKCGLPIKTHIKIDSGMSRFGIYSHRGFSEAAADEAEKIVSLPFLESDGIFTHFAEAESDDPSFTDEQFESFVKTVEILKSRGISFNFCHCANSAAVVNYKRAHLDCVRPGILLYGYSPTGENPEGLNIAPAMTITATVADVHDIKKGDSVSYNRRFVAEHDMRVAVVGGGYADGIPRALSNRAEFLIGGKRARILGNVCMDLTILDVTDIPNVKRGDSVVIFGSQDGETISPDELAGYAGTITYELLTSVSKRVPRTYSRTHS